MLFVHAPQRVIPGLWNGHSNGAFAAPIVTPTLPDGIGHITPPPAYSPPNLGFFRRIPAKIVGAVPRMRSEGTSCRIGKVGPPERVSPACPRRRRARAAKCVRRCEMRIGRLIERAPSNPQTHRAGRAELSANAAQPKSMQ